MASVTIPSETACGLIARGLQESIAREIERVVHEHVDARITAIAMEKAAEVICAGDVQIVKDCAANSTRMSFTFSGTSFDLNRVLREGGGA